MKRAIGCFLQLLFILPYTIQYSLVVNDSEEVFTIDGQVYSTLPNLECLQQQGVRCRVAECHGSRGYIRVKKWLNVEKLGNFNGGKCLDLSDFFV